MIKLKMENDIGWCLIPPYIMANEDLNMTEKVVYGRILGLTKDKGYCYASNGFLGKQMDVSKRTIQRAISSLKDKRLITIDRIYAKNGKVKQRRIFVAEVTNLAPSHDKNVTTPHDKYGTDSIRDKSIEISNISKANKNNKTSKTIGDLRDKKKELLNKMGAPTKEWQDHAVRIAESLNVKPNSSWFKLFRDSYYKNRKGLLMTAYASMADLETPPPDPEKYFYKVYWEQLNAN